MTTVNVLLLEYNRLFNSFWHFLRLFLLSRVVSMSPWKILLLNYKSHLLHCFTLLQFPVLKVAVRVLLSGTQTMNFIILQSVQVAQLLLAFELVLAHYSTLSQEYLSVYSSTGCSKRQKLLLWTYSYCAIWPVYSQVI